jgi:hypothetical protein
MTFCAVKTQPQLAGDGLYHSRLQDPRELPSTTSNNPSFLPRPFLMAILVYHYQLHQTFSVTRIPTRVNPRTARERERERENRTMSQPGDSEVKEELTADF